MPSTGPMRWRAATITGLPPGAVLSGCGCYAVYAGHLRGLWLCRYLPEPVAGPKTLAVERSADAAKAWAVRDAERRAVGAVASA